MLMADCQACAGLCCVSLAFDRGPLFAEDKPAGAPCPHLSSQARCNIHTLRARRGFAGCVSYDCQGAGQRVTQELFQGKSWQGEPGLLHGMLEAFRSMRQVHELLFLLQAAAQLPLLAQERDRLEELAAALEPVGGWTYETLAELEQGTLPDDVAAFLRSLAATARRHLKLLPSARLDEPLPEIEQQADAGRDACHQRPHRQQVVTDQEAADERRRDLRHRHERLRNAEHEPLFVASALVSDLRRERGSQGPLSEGRYRR